MSRIVTHVPIQHWQTLSGVPVLFVERHEIPMVDICVTFAAGSAYDKEKYGLSQLTNSLLSQGTKQHDADQIAAGFEEVGAHFTANSDRDMALVSFRSLTLPKYFDAAFHLFIEVLSSPSFSPHDFLRMQKLVLSALQQQEQMPEIIARNAFYKNLYGTHPYAHSVLGNAETVTALVSEDVTQFYKEFYVRKKALLLIVGDITRKKAEAIAHQCAASLAEGEAAISLPIAANNIGLNQHIIFPSEQTHILMGQLGFNYEDPYFFPLLLGNYILGGSSLTSRLFHAVRGTHGLAYSIFTTFSFYQAKGPFNLLVQTRYTETRKTLALINKLLSEFINKGPTAKELAAARKKITRGFPLTFASNANILEQLYKIGFYHLPLGYLDHYCEKINAVTLKQIQQAFEERFHLKQFVIIRVGKR